MEGSLFILFMNLRSPKPIGPMAQPTLYMMYGDTVLDSAHCLGTIYVYVIYHCRKELTSQDLALMKKKLLMFWKVLGPPKMVQGLTFFNF